MLCAADISEAGVYKRPGRSTIWDTGRCSRSPRELALAYFCSETEFIPRPIRKDGGSNMHNPLPLLGCRSIRPYAPLGCPVDLAFSPLLGSPIDPALRHLGCRQSNVKLQVAGGAPPFLHFSIYPFLNLQPAVNCQPSFCWGGLMDQA